MAAGSAEDMLTGVIDRSNRRYASVHCVEGSAQPAHNLTYGSGMGFASVKVTNMDALNVYELSKAF